MLRSLIPEQNGPDLDEGDSSDEYISGSTPQRKKRKKIAPEDAALSAAKRLKYDRQIVGSSLPPRPAPAPQSEAPSTREELEKMLTDAESDEATATEVFLLSRVILLMISMTVSGGQRRRRRAERGGAVLEGQLSPKPLGVVVDIHTVQPRPLTTLMFGVGCRIPINLHVRVLNG
jgi:hypothetical protein